MIHITYVISVMSTIFSLHNEILESIFFYLTPHDILNCKQVCKLFNDISYSNYLWKQFCRYELSQYEIDNMLQNNDYYHLYIKWYNVRDFINRTHYFDEREQNSIIAKLYNSKYLDHFYVDNKLLSSSGQRAYKLIHHFHSELSNLPRSIRFLTNLIRINLDGNLLESIPTELSLLVNLQDIQLSNNQITTIPDEICSLTNLIKLDLGRNKIKIIPEKINNLISLKSLNLRNNLITLLPSSIYKFKNTRIDLSNNLITTLSSDCLLIDINTKIILHHNKISNYPDNLPKHNIFIHGEYYP